MSAYLCLATPANRASTQSAAMAQRLPFTPAIEAQRIVEYARGWHDAINSEPQSSSLAYLRGYRDARQPGGTR